MGVPTSKTELLDAISKTFGNLISDLERVPPELARTASMEGHAAGMMISPADLVAYLLGWNELVLRWLERDDRGEVVEFPETGFKWNQLGLLAQKFYADYQHLDWQNLLIRLAAVNHRLVETISSRTHDELYGSPWYGKWTKGRMIQFNTSSPYANARSRIRKWLKTVS
ncbi:MULTISPECIES: ClbS/DfsB family four-helix bundle protein [Rhodobacterales]|nr:MULTISPECIES: ClbS/DfsB family four-helix bundle protein [Rhodobacterales]NIZ10185.1 ClbS/DfsB family four-helix bundle protein [Pseudooceanicola sp. HF7]